MTRRAGLSLAEVLVAGALAVLVLGVGLKVLVPAFQVWRRGLAHSQVQQVTMIAENWVRYDVEHAAPDSLACPGGGLWMVVQGHPLQYDSSGSLLWHESVLYWLKDGELHRQSALLSPALTQPTLTPAPSPSPQARVIARNVQAFQCQLTNPGLIRLHVEARDGKDVFVLDSSASTIMRPPPQSASP